MTVKTDTICKKIRDADLRRFACSDLQESKSVLLEVCSKRELVKISSWEHGGFSSKRVAGFEHEASDTELEAKSVDRTETYLTSRGLAHTYLRSAKAFVVSTSPPQLRALVELPSICAVIPNRVVHRTS